MRLPDRTENGVELWLCRGDCGEYLPRNCFGGGKAKMNVRCNAQGNGCEAAYRRKKRTERRILEPGSTFDAVVAEIGDDRKADLSNLTEDEKKARKSHLSKLAKWKKKLPSNLRELYELEKLQSLIGQYGVKFFARHTFYSQVVHRKLGWIDGGKFHAYQERGRSHIQRRIAMLYDHIAPFGPKQIEEAMKAERDELGDTSGQPGLYIREDRVDENDPEIQKVMTTAYNRMERHRRFRRREAIEKAPQRPTLSELEDFMAENSWRFDSTDFVEAHWHGLRPGDWVSHHRAGIAKRLGDTRSYNKFQARADESDAQEAKFDAEFAEYIRRKVRDKYQDVDPLPTWEELAPWAYSSEAIEQSYGKKSCKRDFDAYRWQAERWVVLSDADLTYLEALAESGCSELTSDLVPPCGKFYDMETIRTHGFKFVMPGTVSWRLQQNIENWKDRVENMEKPSIV